MTSWKKIYVPHSEKTIRCACTVVGTNYSTFIWTRSSQQSKTLRASWSVRPVRETHLSKTMTSLSAWDTYLWRKRFSTEHRKVCSNYGTCTSNSFFPMWNIDFFQLVICPHADEGRKIERQRHCVFCRSNQSYWLARSTFYSMLFPMPLKVARQACRVVCHDSKASRFVSRYRHIRKSSAKATIK